MASSLDITNANFMNGIHRFAGNGAAGAILNQGTLTAAEGGYIALLAPQVRNEGVVAARMGTVAFGAGEAIRLDMSGTGLIEIQVEKAAVDALIANRSQDCSQAPETTSPSTQASRPTTARSF